MEHLIITTICIIILAIMWYVLEINIKKLKQIAENDELNKFTDTFPENIDICKSILKKLKNEEVVVKEEKESKTSLYMVFNNTISIANIRNSYTRIQTIAHECQHSIQSKKMLWFNFIFTNIYLIYFATIIILDILKANTNSYFLMIILVIFAMTQYSIRSMLETDAMIKARYIAKEYLEENKICEQEKINEIVEKYDELNNIGVKVVNYDILAKNIIKILIFSLVCYAM